ncbi:MAG: GTPase, partial [Deltaproteobacteria bacterium]
TLPPPPPGDDDGATDEATALAVAAANAYAPYESAEPPREIIVTDTVGFIRELPKDLVAAFRATFEEAADADLLIHIVDASDARYEDHMETTEKLIDELGLREVPRLLVFNKLDAAPPGVGAALARAHNGVIVSALVPASLAPLLQRLEHHLFELPRRARGAEREVPPWTVVGNG